MLLGLPAPFPAWTWLLLPMGARDPPVRASTGGTEAGRSPQSLNCKIPRVAEKDGNMEDEVILD